MEISVTCFKDWNTHDKVKVSKTQSQKDQEHFIIHSFYSLQHTHSKHHNYVEHCPMSDTHLIYTTF